MKLTDGYSIYKAIYNNLNSGDNVEHYYVCSNLVEAAEFAEKQEEDTEHGWLFESLTFVSPFVTLMLKDDEEDVMPEKTKGNLHAYLDHAWTNGMIDTQTVQAFGRKDGAEYAKMSADEFKELLRSNPGEPVLRNVGDKRIAQLRRYFLET